MIDQVIDYLSGLVLEVGIALVILILAIAALFLIGDDRERVAKSGYEAMRWISAGVIAGAVGGFVLEYGRPFSTILAACGISTQIYIEWFIRKQEDKLGENDREEDPNQTDLNEFGL